MKKDIPIKKKHVEATSIGKKGKTAKLSVSGVVKNNGRDSTKYKGHSGTSITYNSKTKNK